MHYRLHRINHESGSIEYYVWDDSVDDILAGPMPVYQARLAAALLNMGRSLEEALTQTSH